jgi:hypothetical protein
MPVISRFFGIAVYMYWSDHTPAHFHAKYQDQEIIVEIESGLIKGHMGKKAVALIQEWRELHKDELIADWERALQKMTLRGIAPLE